jgi:hypothetical protein
MGIREQLFISLRNKCSLTIAATWTAYQSFDLRFKQRKQSYRLMETLIEADQVVDQGDQNDVIANGKSHSVTVAESLGLDEKTLGHKVAVKDVESSSRVVVTALGKLGLIMAYFYLCDR